MPAFSFNARFVPAIENGLALRIGEPLPHAGVRPKTQTIRAERKDGRVPAKVGDTLHLYTGMRTKTCRKLGEVRCRSVDRFELRVGNMAYGDWGGSNRWQRTFIARRDGFESFDEMRDWFKRVHGLPFSGWLIRW